MQVKVTDNSAIFKKAKDEAVARALEAIGLTAERHAKENCPVDTGLLRNSITYAVSGEKPAISSYRADSGSNRYTKGKNAGKRISARSKNAGSVGVGFYRGSAPDDPPDKKAVYIGSNVKYARKQETGNYKHQSGAAHFLRDAAAEHGDEYKRIIETQLKKQVDIL